ncbi:hypothetical protein GW17_00048575, partial [Ensete ventricosum]
LAEGIGGWLGVRQELVEGDRELARKASGVSRKKTKSLTGRSSGVTEKFTGRRSLEDERETHYREWQRLLDCGSAFGSCIVDADG